MLDAGEIVGMVDARLEMDATADEVAPLIEKLVDAAHLMRESGGVGVVAADALQARVDRVLAPRSRF
jgi:hypothetical protein